MVQNDRLITFASKKVKKEAKKAKKSILLNYIIVKVNKNQFWKYFSKAYTEGTKNIFSKINKHSSSFKLI